MKDPQAFFEKLYAAFNARDVDGVLAAMHPDVDWPNGWEGGRVQGHAGIRAYWTRQWAEISPRVKPLRVEQREDGSVAVDVHQLIRSRTGERLADDTVRHVYRFRDGLVGSMKIEPAGTAA